MRHLPRSARRFTMVLVGVFVLLAATGACRRFSSRKVSAAEDTTKIAPVVPASRNLVNTADKDIAIDFSTGENGPAKHLIWQSKLGKTSYGGPTIAGGKIFVGTNNEQPRDPTVKGDHGILMCFDAKGGKFLWQAVHKKLDDDAKGYPKIGIAATPAVDGDRVYYVNNRAELVCADVNGDPQNPGKAKLVWTLDMQQELKIFPCQTTNSSPLIVGDLVYIVTGHGQNVGTTPWELENPEAPSFIAVEKKTGKVAWKDNSPGKNIMEGQWTSPVYANPKGGKPQVIFPGGDGWLYAFTPDKGKLIWKFNGNAKDAVYDPANKRISDKAYWIAAPVVHEDRLYIGLGTNPDDGPGPGRLFCLDLTKEGDVSVKDDDFDAQNPKNKGSALVWSFGGKIVPKPAKGRDIRFGRTVSTVAVHDGLLFIAEIDGYFHCLDAKTGKAHWEDDLRTGVWASPYVVDGKVFLGNDDGDLLVYAATATKKRLAKIAIGPPVKTPVQVVDGVLYLMTDGYLHAIGKK